MAATATPTGVLAGIAAPVPGVTSAGTAARELDPSGVAITRTEPDWRIGATSRNRPSEPTLPEPTTVHAPRRGAYSSSSRRPALDVEAFPLTTSFWP